MEAERLWAGGPLFLQAETAKLTTDTVLLADFAQIGRATSGADLGCASGALMLLLLWREARLQMTGVELQPDAARLAEENLRLNGMADRGTILCGDLREEHAALPRGGFDFVIANPPYFAEGSGLPAPAEGRAPQRGKGLPVLSAGTPLRAAAAVRGCPAGTEAPAPRAPPAVGRGVDITAGGAEGREARPAHRAAAHPARRCRQ